MKPLKSKISITLDPDIIVDLKDLAEEDDRSLSQYINLILREYLTRKNSKNMNSN
ncbi:MAG: toxin-antitoxin system protein [Lachnospiraceae bacterium]|nr:toxin-antitoxin system protein [Lachnospiraceae bacterium]